MEDISFASKTENTFKLREKNIEFLGVFMQKITAKASAKWFL